MNIAEQSVDELMKLKHEELKRIIEDNRLNVKCEECVWDILLKWVVKDPDNRKNDLAKLLPMVRFGLMESNYFIENVIVNFYHFASLKLYSNN